MIFTVKDLIIIYNDSVKEIVIMFNKKIKLKNKILYIIS